MGIILAGDRSGTGKTTLTLALLAALKKRRHRVQSFKVGPDYIDPMFHAAVTGRACYNLDPALTSEAYVQQSYQAHCSNADDAVIEGVMGLFDGATGVDNTASTAHVARLLNLPVLLAVDCGRMARSLAALVQGYRTFDARVNVVGVILNQVGSDRHLQLLRDALAAINMPIYGVFRREKEIQLPSRHLGLVPTGEIGEFGKVAERLAALGERCFDWERLAGWLEVEQGENVKKKEKKKKVRIVIARDAAFNFYYADNLAALSEQGAELVYWSPLEDEALPAAEGLYFGGGFPEVFAARLSENRQMAAAIRQAISQAMPTYAECGGLMYLSRALIDFDGKPWPMLGVIPQTVTMGERLVLGYRRGRAIANGPLLTEGQTVVGHEFHKSSVIERLDRPIYKTQRYWGELTIDQLEGYYQINLHASYVHLHWGHQPSIAKRFVQQCEKFAARH
ncbi:MAG: cobyrinate a,c-diamide synthase [Phormidesmis sp.]